MDFNFLTVSGSFPKVLDFGSTESPFECIPGDINTEVKLSVSLTQLLLAWLIYVFMFQTGASHGHVLGVITFLDCCFVVDTKLGVKKERCKFGD